MRVKEDEKKESRREIESEYDEAVYGRRPQRLGAYHDYDPSGWRRKEMMKQARGPGPALSSRFIQSREAPPWRRRRHQPLSDGSKKNEKHDGEDME